MEHAPSPKKKMTKREQLMAKKLAAKAAATIPPVLSEGSQAPSDISATHEEIHRAVLLASISGQPFEDAKFFTFSRRTRNGTIDTPLPLIANTRHLRKVAPYFDSVFGLGFAEGEVSDMDAPYSSARPPTAISYDYQSDSDLEDEDGGEEADFQKELTRVNVPNAAADVATSEETQSVSKGEDKEDTMTDETALIGIGLKRMSKPGRVVYLEDVAFTTWKAFIYYAYFQELNFAPLKSQLRSRPAPGHDSFSYTPPSCSPKSMYRVAHKYDIPFLKKEALNDIKAKLSPLNIFEELFSTFTSLYSDVRDVELEYLSLHVKDASIQARFPMWLEMLEKNQLPNGSFLIFASLFSKLSLTREAQPPSTSPSTQSTAPLVAGFFGSSLGHISTSEQTRKTPGRQF